MGGKALAVRGAWWKEYTGKYINRISLSPSSLFNQTQGNIFWFRSQWIVEPWGNLEFGFPLRGIYRDKSYLWYWQVFHFLPCLLVPGCASFNKDPMCNFGLKQRLYFPTNILSANTGAFYYCDYWKMRT